MTENEPFAVYVRPVPKRQTQGVQAVVPAGRGTRMSRGARLQGQSSWLPDSFIRLLAISCSTPARIPLRPLAVWAKELPIVKRIYEELSIVPSVIRAENGPIVTITR